MKINALKIVTFGLVLAIAGPAALADNIVINGSFEQNAVTAQSGWDIFTTLPGWKLARGPSIELQRNVRGWAAADGQQYLELDTDIDGPLGSMSFSGDEDASSAVYQDVATTPGEQYELRFAFSPRPGVAGNDLEVKFDDIVIDTLTADGSSLSNTDWQYFTYTVTATSDSTRLEFGDVGPSDSLGTFIDNVSLVAIVPEPAGLLLLTGGVLLASRRR